MRRTVNSSTAPLLLGIEGGATHTVMLLATARFELVQRVETGPGNVRLLSDADLRSLLQTPLLARKPLRAIGIGMAGARLASDRDRIRRAAESVWPGVPCVVTHDLETALAASDLTLRRPGSLGSGQCPASTAAGETGPGETRVLLLSGTGSCCYGRNRAGTVARVGGWGHQLGDRGSAYALAMLALSAVVQLLDRTGCWPRLGQRLLRKAGLNHPDDLIAWLGSTDKAGVAGLAVEVFGAAREGDSLARSILRQGARELAEDALACANRLEPDRIPVTFVLTGTNLLCQPGYRQTVARILRSGRTGSRIILLRKESAWGAVLLAARRTTDAPAQQRSQAPVALRRELEDVPGFDLNRLATSPTEQRNPRSIGLDHLPIPRAIELFLSEELCVAAALRRETRSIEKACRTIVSRLRKGGRLFYVGAGTSGRLGVLDASECPPTFCSDPEQVQGILAGGARALSEAVEGAEDDVEGGAEAVHYRGVCDRDVVVGIAASGRTPFVWGALAAARKQGAATVLVCFDPALKRLRRSRPQVIIAPNVGPELLTGSTRLKAGTATKLLLNMFSTLGMVGLGKVFRNWMVDLNPSNAKLRDRAVRLVQAIAGCDRAKAEAALRHTNWVVRRAITAIRPSCQYPPLKAGRRVPR